MAKVKRVTIREVAAAAEVSPATVSMVLNNSERNFSQDVRTRVLSAVKRLKYQPSGVGRPATGPSKKKLESRRNKVVFLLDAPYVSVSESIYSQVQKGAELELSKARIDLIIQNTGASMLPMETAGVILTKPNPAKMRLVGRRPFVCHMGTLDRSEMFDHITYCNREVPRLVAEHLLAQGHSHIGCINICNSVVFSERVEILRQMVQSAGKTFSSTMPMDHADLFDNPGNLEKVLTTYFSAPDRPTALFVPADTVTSIAYPLLYSMGIIPGKDIKIVSCNNEYLRLAGLNPRPAVVDIKAYEAGRFAALQLLSRIDHPKAPPVKMQLMPELIKSDDWEKRVRESVYNGL
jgi:LacI family transcriptional regulator